MVTRWLPSAVAALVLAMMSVLFALGPISRAIGIACVIASFAAAAAVARRDVRAHSSVIAGIAAVTAAGQTDGGWVYGVAVAAFFAVAIVTLRAARSSGETPAADGRALAKIFGVAGAIVAAAALVLPPAAVAVERYVTAMMGLEGEEATAFSTTMVLGATRGMLQSNAIVLRIDGGEGIGYLRGAVYDTYTGSRWVTSGEGRERTTVRSSAGATARMTLDRHAPRGDDMRWFVPANGCAFDIDVEVDAFGVVRRSGGPVPQRLGFATRGCTPITARPPTPRDLEVRPEVRPHLEPIASKAAEAATSPHDKLLALSREPFRGFEYSLSVPRDDRLDPLVDFMTVHRAGHCEMFASAMVMLARTQGIPARVVGGYRVSEVNPITGQLIVRDRNAHAWVEAWYDGAWHAFDPTPAVDGPGARAGFFDHLGDLWGLFTDRLAEIGPLAYAAALGVVIVLLLAVRSVTQWVRRPRRSRAVASLERPLPCFETLIAALERAGCAWDPAEPLESFAARLPAQWKEATAALGAYAALRYGGIGDEGAVERQVESAARATSSGRS